ncbi:MAG: heme biosynthesis protein HemY, partial [Proteobacteria bacterium]|nr:heme biosynthesis protein HemY [Pseudomonadota bacterium]
RLDRVRQLAALNPHSIESPIAVASTATEARMYDEARRALEPLLTDRLTQRVAMLMARIEAGENGEKGRVREWLARAMNAARDPVWLADGVISDHWEPTSPVDGRLDAFQWRVPVETTVGKGSEILANKIDELIAIAPVAGTPDTGPSEPVKASSADGIESKLGLSDSDVVEAEPVTVTVKPNGAFPEAAVNGATGPLPVADDAATVSKRPSPDRVPAPRPDAKVFVAPRAPDDPGTDPAEPEIEQPIARRNFRTVN